MSSGMEQRILFADDDATVRAAFERTSRALGLDVDLASDGQEALRMARHHNYAVVLTDLNMNGLDGLTLIEALSPLAPDATYMLVTGSELRFNREIRAHDCIFAVIEKPWDLGLLENMLRRALELNAQRSSRGLDLYRGEPDLPVMVVEDGEGDALLVTTMLEELGEEDVVVAHRLSEAIERAHGRRFGAILADMCLPDGRGVDVVVRLQQVAPTAAIVVTSGTADEALALQTIELGAQDYLIKGCFDVRTLGRTLRYARVRKRAEARFMEMAHCDSLTCLANRLGLQEAFERAVGRARRNASPMALLLVDLDGFKAVNDSLGHEAGDLVLCEVARRLRRAMRDYDVVARLGGDEFAVLLSDLGSGESLGKIAGRVQACLQEPVLINGQEARVGASVGGALTPRGGGTLADLLRRADAAMYSAKRSGKGRVLFADAACGRSS